MAGGVLEHDVGEAAPGRVVPATHDDTCAAGAADPGDASGEALADPSGEIADLLERRDTWSGRSVFWPLTGKPLKVPVDLAALPVYDRNRVFEGFRGFGVIRAADAMRDPEKIGLALAPNVAPTEEDIQSGPAPERQSPEELESVDPFDFVRLIAVARITMPRAMVRLSAGREMMDDALQSLCFLAGANSMFYGEKLLVTQNPQAEHDRALLARLGMRTSTEDKLSPAGGADDCGATSACATH